jgi:hypothetical protein
MAIVEFPYIALEQRPLFNGVKVAPLVFAKRLTCVVIPLDDSGVMKSRV